MKIVKQTDQFIIVKPEQPVKGGKAPDLYVDAIRILEHDWASMGAKSFMWDTMTHRAKVFLDMAAQLGKFGAGTQFGSGPSQHRIPTIGDYGAAQALCRDLQFYLNNQLGLHYIVAGHTGKQVQNNITVAAGFALVGTARISDFGYDFDQYVRLFVKGMGQARKIMLQLKAGSTYGAGIRTVHDVPEEIEIPFDLDGMRQVWERIIEWCGIGDDRPMRLGMYSDPKVGKTLFATSLPERMLPMVYVADDPGSESMPSTWTELLAME